MEYPDFQSLPKLKKKMEELGEKLSTAKLQEKSIGASSLEFRSGGGDGRRVENLALKIARLEDQYREAYLDYYILYCDAYMWVLKNIKDPIGGPRERLILVARYVKSLPWDQTARYVGDPEEATRKYAQRYLKKLREIFDGLPL